MILTRLARLGYASVGTVYMIVGGFALASGLGRRGSSGSHQEALTLILRQPFGRTALVVIAVGLAGYMLWRLVSGVTDGEQRGNDAKGLAIRAGSIGRGLLYGALAVEVVRLLMRGGSSGGGEQKTHHWTARVMDAPFGRWIVALAGLCVVGYGAYQLYAAWDSKLSKRIKLGEIDSRVRSKVIAISRFGIGARGIVFFVIGGSLVLAAFRHDASQAHATSGALAVLPEPLLILVGIGLVAYGVYALVNARYRSITT